MEKRVLGRSDLKVAPLAFGGNVFGWTVDEEMAFTLLDQFVAGGYNLIDTADVYSNWKPGNAGGESEIIIGRWMKERGNRSSIIIATKGGSSMIRGGKKNLSANYLVNAVEQSLERLQTDYIDLYQSHYDDPDTDPHETLEAYARLVESGKIRWIGASNFSHARLRESLDISSKLAYPRYQTIQPEYNLYQREAFETGLAKICKEEELSVLPYYGLASGFLTGKYRTEADLSKSTRGEGIRKYFTERGFRILDTLDLLSEKYHATPAIISLAWLQSRPLVAAPIASATNPTQLSELIRSTEIDLHEEDLELLDHASSQAVS